MNAEWKKIVSDVGAIPVKQIVPINNWKSKNDVVLTVDSFRELLKSLRLIVSKYERMTLLDKLSSPIGSGKLSELIEEIEKHFKNVFTAIESLNENANKDDYKAVISKLRMVRDNVLAFTDAQKPKKSRSNIDASFANLLALISRIPSTIDAMINRIENITMMTNNK